MNRNIRFVSALLALLMLMGTFSLATVVSADETTGTTGSTTASTATVDTYLTKYYPLKEDKLADMALMKTEKGYNIYVLPSTGEVAVQNVATGQTLFTNPYDLNSPYNTASQSTKKELLSQIILTYTDNGVTKTMYSFEEAALRNQITVKNIKNGIRVEYILGEPDTNYLVPRLIEKDRFEALILEAALSNGISNFYYERIKAYYILKDPNDPSLSDRLLKDMFNYYPITQTEYTSTTYSGKMAIYTIQSDIVARELRELEDLITTYCPKYTYEELEYDHTLTNYTAVDEAPPLFRLALEYTIEDNGFSVRLPASGLRYDESAYTIQNVSVLPYMGSGTSGVISDKDLQTEATEITYLDGYTFIPDGSGSLIRFKDLIGTAYTVYGDVYGTDFAYHQISRQHAETMRWPVFGTVVDYDATVYWETTKTKDDGTVEIIQHTADVDEERGFLAVITEGESMAEITSSHGGLKHTYNTVYATFSPLPTDSYEVKDSISVSGTTSTWTVTSDRKYTGSYKIRYIMLEGEDAATAAGKSSYYDCSYVGMAAAYRDYLYENGTLSRLENTGNDIPLYVESFGSITTTERVLSIPVEVDTPLTTFGDIKTMYNELTNARYCAECGTYVYTDDEASAHGEECKGTLSEVGVNKMNFRLTGFANGGMSLPTYPSTVKWVKSVGSNDDYTDLISFAEEKGVGIYPDFNFLYLESEALFDGVSLRKDAVKTIDNRYSVKRYYDAATQTFQKSFATVISASVFEKFYDKMSEKLLSFYEEGMSKSISVSTLGTDLNSDFDEDDPYNREDAKLFSQRVLSSMASDFNSVMTDGGNAYTLPYVDVILNVATDSSRYIRASEAVPFIGMVLHGSMQYASDPINMEGDIAEAILRAIENGADPYFILSYANTTLLKNDKDLSKYYSVSYEIWRDELIEVYQTLNEALGDLQTSWIVDHEFLDAKRIPTDEERAEDEANGIAPDDVRYDTASGTVVVVTYEGGTSFILNYNSYDITVEYEGTAYTISSFDFVEIG